VAEREYALASPTHSLREFDPALAEHMPICGAGKRITCGEEQHSPNTKKEPAMATGSSSVRRGKFRYVPRSHCPSASAAYRADQR